jgi:hypothetical protein
LPDLLFCSATGSSSSALRYPFESLAGALANRADALSGTLPETLHALLRTFADAFESRLRAVADACNSALGTMPDLLDRSTDSLAHVLNRVARVGEQIVRPAADVPERLAHALQQLRVPVQSREHTGQDLRDLGQPDLEQSLGLYVLYVQLDLAEPDGRAGIQLDEVADLSEQCDVRPEVVELELDLVDLDDGRVDEDVDGLLDLVGIDD